MRFVVSLDAVKPEQKHLQKPPNDFKEVEAFIGLITYFGRMIPNYAAKTRCVRELRQIDKSFEWTDECQRAFQSLEDELTSEPLVQLYTLAKEVTPNTDASEKPLVVY